MEALRTDDKFGIWGGYTGPERGRIVTRYGAKKLTGPKKSASAITGALIALDTGVLDAQVIVL